MSECIVLQAKRTLCIIIQAINKRGKSEIKSTGKLSNYRNGKSDIC